jgi:hypothetical protein
MKKKDENFIVCCRVGKSKRNWIKGSIKKKCSICNNEVWVSPATLESIEVGLYKGKIVCLTCMNKKMRSLKK